MKSFILDSLRISQSIYDMLYSWLHSFSKLCVYAHYSSCCVGVEKGYDNGVSLRAQVSYTIVWMAICSEMGYYRSLYGPSVLLQVLPGFQHKIAMLDHKINMFWPSADGQQGEGGEATCQAYFSNCQGVWGNSENMSGQMSSFLLHLYSGGPSTSTSP